MDEQTPHALGFGSTALLGRRYRVVFDRHMILYGETPPLRYLWAHVIAFLYRAKGDGRAATVVDAVSTFRPNAQVERPSAPGERPDEKL